MKKLTEEESKAWHTQFITDLNTLSIAVRQLNAITEAAKVVTTKWNPETKELESVEPVINASFRDSFGDLLPMSEWLVLRKTTGSMIPDVGPYTIVRMFEDWKRKHPSENVEQSSEVQKEKSREAKVSSEISVSFDVVGEINIPFRITSEALIATFRKMMSDHERKYHGR